MSHLTYVFEAINAGKPDIKIFRGKNILLIGGYTLQIMEQPGGGVSPYAADVLKKSFLQVGAKSVKKAANFEQNASEGVVCDYVGNIEELPKIINEEFDIVFALEGLEKVNNPIAGLEAIRNLCTRNGRMILFLRTPKELGTKYRLDYYEDTWRYEIEDLKQFFRDDRDCSSVVNPAGEVFIMSVKKTARNFQADEKIPFFNCRVKRKVTYSESVNFGYFRDCVELKRIAEGELTDKVEHHYLDKYEFLLNKLKDREFKLLELGVFDGGSLRMWKRYFPKAEIYGVDINERCKKYEEERINIEIMDLSSLENLEKLKAIKPDIIIDDASHIWSHQLKSLFNLFPILPSGGIFIMEDMETSVNVDLFPGFNDIQVNPYDICERIARVVISKRADRINDTLSELVTDVGMATEFISMIKGSCIMIKR